MGDSHARVWCHLRGKLGMSTDGKNPRAVDRWVNTLYLGFHLSQRVPCTVWVCFVLGGGAAQSCGFPCGFSVKPSQNGYPFKKGHRDSGGNHCCRPLEGRGGRGGGGGRKGGWVLWTVARSMSHLRNPGIRFDAHL